MGSCQYWRFLQIAAHLPVRLSGVNIMLIYFNNKNNFFVQLQNSFLEFAFLSIWRMPSKYSTKQYISAQYCDKQMSEIWCKNIQVFLRCSNFCVGIFYFASPCKHVLCCVQWTWLRLCRTSGKWNRRKEVTLVTLRWSYMNPNQRVVRRTSATSHCPAEVALAVFRQVSHSAG